MVPPQHQLQAVLLSRCAGVLAWDAESPVNLWIVDARFDGVYLVLLDCFVVGEYNPDGPVRLCMSVPEGLWVQQS